MLQNLHLYIPLHTIYSRTYIVRALYELVPARNSSSGLTFSLTFKAHTTPNLHELKKALDASRDGLRANIGASRPALGAKLDGFSVACEELRSMQAQTEEVNIFLINNPTPWVNVLGIFSPAPAHKQPLDTERLRCIARNSARQHEKGGNEERDGRRRLVKLLTSLSYCVGGSFIPSVF